MQVITAPHYAAEYARPAIFLAGAITGAADWQAYASDLLQDDFATSFNPRRADGFRSPAEPDYLASYQEQVAWEHEHLLAADVVLFWLPAGAEAITTRFELGWWFGKHFFSEQKTKSARFVVGIEPGVKGDTYYRVVLPQYGLEVFNSLEATCQQAARLAKNLTK